MKPCLRDSPIRIMELLWEITDTARLLYLWRSITGRDLQYPAVQAVSNRLRLFFIQVMKSVADRLHRQVLQLLTAPADLRLTCIAAGNGIEQQLRNYRGSKPDIAFLYCADNLGWLAIGIWFGKTHIGLRASGSRIGSR